MALEDQSQRGNGKPVILVICDYYLPGYESGGAMRTLVNMVDRLSDEYEFKLITRDHDGPLNRMSYKNVAINGWNRVGNASVYYLSRNNINRRTLAALIAGVTPSAIYLNSFFSPLTISVLALRKLGTITGIPIVLAPEGEFSGGALKLKTLKKQLYLTAAKSLGLLRKINWKAAAESEVQDITRVLGPQEHVMIAPNLPPAMIFAEYDQDNKPAKNAGEVKMIFLSRFMRKKNFNWLVPHLQGIKGQLKIDIWGPLEDEEYWAETKRLIEQLPPNVAIEAKGPVPHDRVSQTLNDYHYFILPTLGENFGHVFIEALAAGCPVITSDQTPWRGLEQKGIGWDLSLDRPEEWVRAINECIAMDSIRYREHSARAREYEVKWLTDPQVEASNREVLRAATQEL